MLDTILITLLIVAICIVLLGVKVFFVKGGRFPNGHVSAIRQCAIEVSVACSRRIGKRNASPVFPLMNWKKP